MGAVLSIAIFYVLFPSSLLVPSYDLRPFIFLAPFFLLSILSVAFYRPLWEILLWFNAMFLAREEALLFGIVILIYTFVKIKEHSLRRKALMFLSLSLTIWGLATLSFFIWTGYSTTVFEEIANAINQISELFVSSPWILIPAILGVFGLVAFAVFYWRRLRAKAYYQRILEIMAYSTIFLPLGLEFIRNALPGNLPPTIRWMARLTLDPQRYLDFVALLGLIIIVLFPLLNRNEKSKALPIVTAFFCMLFVSINIIAPSGVLKSYMANQNQISSANDVWGIRKVTDKYKSWILVDYSTHQAFYDYQHVYAYNRLPWDVTPGVARYYPANRQIVQSIVNKDIEYVVVSKDSYSLVSEFLSQGGLVGVKLFENDEFVAIYIIGR